jgi:hypothetical protein
LNFALAVCYLRLDFDSFTTLGPADTLETSGGACRDTFMVGVSIMHKIRNLKKSSTLYVSFQTATNQNIPTICGQNAGQHSEAIQGVKKDNFFLIPFLSSLCGYGRSTRRYSLFELQLCWIFKLEDLGYKGYSDSVQVQLQVHILQR